MCAEPDCDEPVHHWFGLTYSSYLILHRSVMQAMPVGWQRRFVALLEEMEDTVEWEKLPHDFWVRAREGRHFVADPFREYRRPPPIPMRPRTGEQP
jgi:hypothetical protein